MEQVTASVSAQLELHRLNTGRVVPVAAASRIIKQHLFKYQGHVSAYLIVGGVDATGPRLVEVHAAGSSMTVPFTTTGSGCLAAMSVLETQWRRDMDEEDAKRMMKEAIDAGILNDLGSGSTVNMVVVKKDSAEYLRHFFKSQVKGER
jgi:20S proteasome subunit beta 2